MKSTIKELDQKIQDLREQMSSLQTSSNAGFYFLLIRLEYLIRLRAMIMLDKLDLE